jgi:LacI family transcriptional regulator, repressor for deo operon, udp, cdd, tsx, nupC, and nupG
MSKKDPLSIKDIARSAQVSHSTVSRALRNSPLVNADTGARIRRIAAESNFRVSAVGRSLATGRTHSVGVVVSSISDPFIAEVVSGLEEMTSARGYSLILATSQGDPDREIKMVQTFEERRVDGVVLTGGSRLGPGYAPLIAGMKIPVVVMNGQRTADFAYSVAVDNVAAGHSAIRFLAQLGHRRIAYIGDRSGCESNAAREAGYRQGLAAHDLPYLADLVLIAGDEQPEGGMLAMEQLLSLPEPPTAVFCYDDMTALGALSAIRRRHLRVPEDVSVVGFDDLLIASYTQPPLTTIRQPKRLMGRLAGETLFNLLTGKRAPDMRRLATELIVRESTAPPPKQ